ncbi:MAG TPA: RagB/SusD family nutrient uptake outer membrane protein [Gemmatimonadales bacterium]|nr:RagB/SusD family nutrient uptake outer membrane protein [Gemmatimonadales bacterium]
MMKHLLRSLPLMALVAGCNSVLDVRPINEFAEADAITTPGGARAARAGLYDALQDDSYYGGDFLFFSDMSAEDVQHTGTFTTYRQVDQNDLTSDNSSIEDVWDALYNAIGRANIIIERVPPVAGLDPEERDQILGEAYFVRALSYHNLVKLWGEPTGMGVPLVLVPPPDIPSASQVTRASTAEVYTQILGDLAQAEALLTAAGGSSDTHSGSLGAVRAIRARVMLYQGNYAGAEAEAEAVAAMGYALASDYGDLFTPEGDDTPEDIFRLAFDAVDFNYIGYYYLANDAGGRREVTPSDSLLAAYSAGDLRGQRNIQFTDSSDISVIGETGYGAKWVTGVGAEDLHVIRFAEVLLIQAEAEARQNKLGEAEATLTPVRVRAGLAAAGVDTMSQANAISTILNERRLELAYEGDRWPDLVRTGLAATRVDLTGKTHQVLYPIPLNERDVTNPPLPQNPGY